MAKTPKAPLAVTPSALAKAILASDDFGHEVRVRAALEHEGAQVKHGWTYLDPVERKPRLFDLRCSLRHHSFERWLQLAVECKNQSSQAPLIVSGTKRSAQEAVHDFVRSDPAGSSARFLILQSQKADGFYPTNEFVGRNLLRLKPNNDDSAFVPSSQLESEVYDRWSQALSSAHELCNIACLAGRDSRRTAQTFVLPAVVVPDDTLWCIEYDGAGIPEGEPVRQNSATLFVNHEVGELPLNAGTIYLSHIHFFTLKGLRHFLAGRTDPNNPWDDLFPAGSPPAPNAGQFLS